MEMKLDGLIKKIKEEGVEEAKRASENIIKEAKEKAARIIDEARNTKASLIEEGREEAGNLKKSGEEALRQASRDVLLSLRQSITELLGRLIKAQVSEGLSPESMKKIIPKVIENFKKEEGFDIDILLAEQDKRHLESALLKSLKDEFKKGVTFKVSPNVEKGFRIGEKGKNFYYDFTDEAIAEAFRLYLNPKIAKLLNPDRQHDK